MVVHGAMSAHTLQLTKVEEIFFATSLIQYNENIYFMAGKGKNPNNNLINLWVVIKSDDGGNTWKESDHYSV